MAERDLEHQGLPGTGETRQGWLVVVAAMVGVAVGLSPIPFYTIGMFAPELSQAFGWSFASLMATLAIQSTVAIVTSPVAGMVVDRFGARPVAMLSLLLFGLTFMSLGLTNGSLWVFYAQWALMSVAGAGTLSGTWTRVVNGWFDRNRGLALGLASTGTGITGFLIKPFTAWLILTFGWRWSFVVIGLLPIVIGLPVVALLLRERGRTKVAAARVLVIEHGFTFREAIRRRQFWILVASFLLIGFAITAPTPNMENILRSLGFDLPTVAGITGSFGLAVIVGRIAGGWLLDRIWAPVCAFAIMILPATGCWLLAQSNVTEGTAFLAVISLGLAAGFEFDLLAYLVSRYFGQRNYGTIYGCFFAMVAIGGGIGPVAYGRAFDVTGSYAQVLTFGAGALLAGGSLFLLLGAYPVFRRDASEHAERDRQGESPSQSLMS